MERFLSIRSSDGMVHWPMDCSEFECLGLK
jgi:hypothetical protein